MVTWLEAQGGQRTSSGQRKARNRLTPLVIVLDANEDDIPSLYTRVELPCGEYIALYGVHPRPPRPQQDTAERDAELVMVGKLVAQRDEPAIVAGDLNDVAWSHTTTLFQNISHTLDLRVGRGMYNTFDVHHPLLRYPLDHVFHTDHFRLVSLRRLGACGWGGD